jgi:hypothetical protein
VLLMTAASAQADWFGGDCDHTLPRRLTTPSAGVERITIIGKAGKLRVEGRDALAEVVASGVACSSDEDFLQGMNLFASRRGGELRIEVRMPEKKSFFGSFSAALDFTVLVPAGVALSIEDGSGETEIVNVGRTEIEDGSGDLTIRGVRGDLRVTDGSGSLEIADVSGSVRIEDGSGGIDVRRVEGNVTIEDGSGSIDVRNVRRDVLVEDDGSGSIEVSDVGGNFTVREDGGGGISHHRVAGRVEVPTRDR